GVPALAAGLVGPRGKSLPPPPSILLGGGEPAGALFFFWGGGGTTPAPPLPDLGAGGGGVGGCLFRFRTAPEQPPTPGRSRSALRGQGSHGLPILCSRALETEAALEHDPEKACPGLDPGGYRFSEKDHAPLIRLERDDDSKKSHRALGYGQARDQAVGGGTTG